MMRLCLFLVLLGVVFANTLPAFPVNGYYKINLQHSKYLGVPHHGEGFIAAAVTQDKKEFLETTWYIAEKEDGIYSIKFAPQGSNGNMRYLSESMEFASISQKFSGTNSDMQLWRMEQCNNGLFLLQAKSSGRWLTMKNNFAFTFIGIENEISYMSDEKPTTCFLEFARDTSTSEKELSGTYYKVSESNFKFYCPSGVMKLSRRTNDDVTVTYAVKRFGPEANFSCTAKQFGVPHVKAGIGACKEFRKTNSHFGKWWTDKDCETRDLKPDKRKKTIEVEYLIVGTGTLKRILKYEPNFCYCQATEEQIRDQVSWKKCANKDEVCYCESGLISYGAGTYAFKEYQFDLHSQKKCGDGAIFDGPNPRVNKSKYCRCKTFDCGSLSVTGNGEWKIQGIEYDWLNANSLKGANPIYFPEKSVANAPIGQESIEIRVEKVSSRTTSFERTSGFEITKEVEVSFSIPFISGFDTSASYSKTSKMETKFGSAHTLQETQEWTTNCTGAGLGKTKRCQVFVSTYTTAIPFTITAEHTSGEKCTMEGIWRGENQYNIQTNTLTSCSPTNTWQPFDLTPDKVEKKCKKWANKSYCNDPEHKDWMWENCGSACCKTEQPGNAPKKNTSGKAPPSNGRRLLDMLE